MDKVYEIVNDLGKAKQLMDVRDFMSAVDLLSRVLEVSFVFLKLLYFLFEI